MYTDEDKVFEVKYVRHAPQFVHKHDISPTTSDVHGDGSFKLYLGQIHITFLYKLFIQLQVSSVETPAHFAVIIKDFNSQRFFVNLEAICYFERVTNAIRDIVNRATETLKHNSKIHLAVNIKGPVLLFPQKTSSPNVIIVSTGKR